MNLMKTPYKKEWFDDDSFWQEIYPIMFSDTRFAEAEEQVDKILALTKPTGMSALDLCCGPGRCTIALAKKGFSVTGVDRTKYLLNKAREKSKAAKTEIQWVQQDMRHFVSPEAFDLVISMFTSFGYFDNKADDLIVLKNIFTSLRSGGTCLIDVLGKEALARILQPTTSDRLPDGTTLIQRHEVFDEWTRIRNEWLLIRKDTVKRFTFHHTVYSGQELRDRLEQVGFTDVILYGNLDGDGYGPKAQRLIAIGRKPET